MKKPQINTFNKILIIKMTIINNNSNNNGNFICVFECTIVNLSTYTQFTNAAWDWIIKKKKQTKTNKNKQKQKQNKTKAKKKKKSKLH